MPWTLRLKRHGGMKALQAKRVAQYERLARLSQVSRDELLVACFTFLNGNPLRVLGSQVEAYLDDLEPKTPSGETS